MSLLEAQVVFGWMNSVAVVIRGLAQGNHLPPAITLLVAEGVSPLTPALGESQLRAGGYVAHAYLLSASERVAGGRPGCIGPFCGASGAAAGKNHGRSDAYDSSHRFAPLLPRSPQGEVGISRFRCPWVLRLFRRFTKATPNPSAHS